MEIPIPPYIEKVFSRSFNPFPLSTAWAREASVQHTLTKVITAIFTVIARNLEFNGEPTLQRFNNFKRCPRCNDEALERYQVIC